MKYIKSIIILFLTMLLFIPQKVLAFSYNSEHSFNSLIDFNAIIQPGAIVNNNVNPNNVSLIIVGMVVIILVLVGATMFAPKK